MPQIYNGKRMYLFEYSHPLVKDYSEFVIPFGKRKTNTPYKKSEKNLKAITEETEELFDVNLLYYSKEYDAAIITADKDAPNSKAIEFFLNCFLDTKKYKLRIKPIPFFLKYAVVQSCIKMQSQAVSDWEHTDKALMRFAGIVNPDSLVFLSQTGDSKTAVLLYNGGLVLLGLIVYIFIQTRRTDSGE